MTGRPARPTERYDCWVRPRIVRHGKRPNDPRLADLDRGEHAVIFVATTVQCPRRASSAACNQIDGIERSSGATDCLAG